MKESFLRALERFGANGAAEVDWRFLLGGDLDGCGHLLKSVGRVATQVIDPRAPKCFLDVEAGGQGGFIGVDEGADRTPILLSNEDVRVLVPTWTEIGRALGELIGFAANIWDTSGICRKIGITRQSVVPPKPVILGLPGSGVGGHVRLLRELSARTGAVVLLPTAAHCSPDLDALAARNELEIVNLSSLQIGPTHLAAPTVPYRVNRKSAKPVLRPQSDWTWEDLTVEVGTNGKVTFRCRGEEGTYRFKKASGQHYSKGYRILLELAAMAFKGEQPEWRNPPSGHSEHEKTRKQFRRLGSYFAELHPVPGKPFLKAGRAYIPRFKVVLGKELVGLIPSGDRMSATLENQ